MHILHVVGARPNFMKVAPVMAALACKPGIRQTLIHTGQHYDPNMSDIFFRQLEIPEPDINLEIGSGSHAIQTAQIMMRFEEVVQEHKPDWVLVYGDVNSTIAAALVCAKLWIPVAHVEAGLRSGDRRMPEEINRLLTDQIASLLFTPSTDGDENLKKEGITSDKIRFVGNVMIDTLIRLLPYAERVDLPGVPDRYVLVTLHRPSNVDEPTMLKPIMETLIRLSERLPVVFPIHPRTRKRLAEYEIMIPTGQQLQLLDPVGYIEFLALQRRASIVITDSGGIQEETTYLGVPCLTLRENTERPVTVSMGTNVLVGRDMQRLEQEVHHILDGSAKPKQIPPLWDGKAGERIADIMFEYA
ncbi:MAG: UDP-N-acetylglucosamine 2-epimerase (non-hydrolyzing) [Chloroflexi bacterium]|nr:UDP-N-acetylglucosamine 2-epimerase (non-hydrolyzing) [Chloroflexota bacterium]